MKRSHIKSVSKTERAMLERQADRLIQKACRLMYRGMCICCKREGHAGHHIVGRRNKDLRHELLNVVYVCDICHRRAESNKEAFLNYLETRWPAIHQWHIDNKNRKPECINSSVLRERIESLHTFIKRMETENVV